MAFCCARGAHQNIKKAPTLAVKGPFPDRASRCIAARGGIETTMHGSGLSSRNGSQRRDDRRDENRQDLLRVTPAVIARRERPKH